MKGHIVTSEIQTELSVQVVLPNGEFKPLGLWMVVFHFLVLLNMACPHTLSRIYLGIWFWGTHGVANIV